MRSSSLPVLLLLACLSQVPMVSAAPIKDLRPYSLNILTPEEVTHLSYNVTAHQSETFQAYHPDFFHILGNYPSLSLILEAPEPYFHEAGVVASNDPPVVYAVSNQFNTTTGPGTSPTHVTTVLSSITQDTSTGKWSYKVVNPSIDHLLLPNGGSAWRNGLLLAAQGNLTAPGGLVYVEYGKYKSGKVIVDNYLGRPFNSPNDVYITRAGTIYFTDPPYGYQQGIRPVPQLPPQVYSYVPGTTQVRVVADGIPHPNGITFSPDETIAYISDTSDTDLVTGLPAARTIYAFDVRHTYGFDAAPMLTNKRVFAMADVGIPDGLKVDARGNVYAGCGDGINIFNPGGVLLGKIIVPGGTSNFAFGDGTIYAFNEKKLYLLKLARGVQPAAGPTVDGTAIKFPLAFKEETSS